MTRLPDHVVERIDTLNRRGLSARQIADAVGCSRDAICDWRKRTGNGKPAPRHLTPQVRSAKQDFARRLIEDGCTIAEAARTVGVSWPIMRSWFPEARLMTVQESAEWAAYMRRLWHGGVREAAL